MMQSDNRKVQMVTLELLKVFIKICEENNLRYFFTGGALIGVLRHKGFIPWDDDIDIGMPRKDYEKLLKISEQVLPGGYRVSNHKTNPDWYFNMSQLIDEETEIEIYMTEVPRKSHIWLDLFPLDGLPAKPFRRWLHIKHILFYRYLIQVAHIQTQVDVHKAGRPLYEKIILKLLTIIPLGKLLNSERLLEKLNDVLTKYDYDECLYAGNMLGRYREREAVPKKYFGHSKQMLFEDVEVAVPEMSHELQTALYGDYMAMPPVDKRCGHHIKIISIRGQYK